MDIQNAIDSITFFFNRYNLTLDRLNVKLNSKGQIDHVSGTLSVDSEVPLRKQQRLIEKEFDKFAPNNYRFLHTKLSLSESRFNIARP